MLPTTTQAKTATQALTGSLTLLTLPTGVDIKTLHLTGTADWTFSFSASGAEFPVGAGLIYEMPMQGGSIYVKGSGTLAVAAYGF